MDNLMANLGGDMATAEALPEVSYKEVFIHEAYKNLMKKSVYKGHTA